MIRQNYLTIWYLETLWYLETICKWRSLKNGILCKTDVRFFNLTLNLLVLRLLKLVRKQRMYKAKYETGCGFAALKFCTQNSTLSRYFTHIFYNFLTIFWLYWSVYRFEQGTDEVLLSLAAVSTPSVVQQSAHFRFLLKSNIKNHILG